MPKSAPPKHKDKNKYRFKTFSERLALVNIDAVHHIKHVQVKEEDSKDFSNFAECLEKWRDLDLSVHFSKFKKDVVGKCKNYKLVIHYAEDLNQALQRHLEVEESLALPSLLELTVALCKDLSTDFYPHFHKYFGILTTLLHTQDVEKLEVIFSALTSLFRHQWRCMIHDMEPLLNMYAKLVTSEQPDHIGAFAAESISFLLRKTRDQQFVVDKLFKMAQENETASTTVARIVFNVVKNAQHQFHPGIKEYLPKILLVLKSRQNAHNEMLTIVSAVKLMGEFTTREHGAPVWKILFTELTKNSQGMQDTPYVVCMLKLLTTWCEVRKGGRLLEHNDLHQYLCCCFKNMQTHVENSTELQNTICELLSTVLCGSNTGLKISEKHNILQLFGTAQIPCSVSCSMWRVVCGAEDFDTFGKNSFLKFCQTNLQESNNKNEVLSLLVEFVCSRQELPLTINDLEHYVPVRLDFSVVSRERTEDPPVKVIAEIIKTTPDPKMLWCAILALQHIQPEKLVKELLHVFLSLLGDCQNERSLAVIAIATQALYCSKKLASFSACHQPIIGLLEQWPSSRHSLFAVSLLIDEEKSLCRLLTSRMKRSLVENVSSFSSPVRLISLQILNQLNTSHAIEHCIKTELITASIQDIRDKLLFVRKLIIHQESAIGQETKEIIVRFLLANFSINFAPLWTGLQEVICSQASEDRNDIFWSVFLEILSQASFDAEISQWWRVDMGLETKASPDNVFEEYLQGESKDSGAIINTRIDCFNFRLQMWKTLSMLPNFHIAESNNKVLVNLLFQFLEEEYYLVDKNHSPLQNLKSQNLVQDEKVHRRKDGVKMLEAMLTVFGKFTNVKSAIRSEELQELYGEFLMHADTEVQNVALQCVFTCESKQMQKYKEQFTGFFEVKKFRDTLADFDLDSIKSNDRKFVISVLLRFLYGRLKSKTGSSTGMKSAPVAGRAIIVRFLCNLTEEEVCTFVDLVIAPFRKTFDFGVGVCRAIELTQVNTPESLECVPLSKQQGVLSTVKIVIEKLRHKLTPDYYSLVLKLLLCSVASQNCLLDCRDNLNTIDRKFISQIKSLKKAAIECVIAILDSWPSDTLLSATEIDAIFKVLVIPDLERQIHENSGSPTMLLKLFNMFSLHVNYRPWFLKSCEGSNSPIVMCKIVDILTFPKTSSEVASFILDIFMNLLVDPSDEETTFSMKDAVSSAGNLSMDCDETSAHDMGLAILKPHLNSIISYFMHKLKGGRRDASLQPKYLELLSEISEVATDEILLSDLSQVILTHVIAVSSKTRSNPEKILVPALKVLSTVASDPSLAAKLSKLFSKINDRESRLLLVKVFCRLSDRDPRLKWTADVVRRLNQWDKRRIEEIDFDSRLTAFQDITAKLKSEECMELFANRCLLLLPILHTCMHTLLHFYADISLRESVSRVLELLVDKVKQLSVDGSESFASVYQTVVKEMVLPTIQSGLRSLDEGCRHESIYLLSKVVRSFPDESLVKNMTNLSNWNDPEDDFYENIRHIQWHRRARAFRRMAKYVSRIALKTDQEESMKVDKNNEPTVDRLIPCSVASRFLLPIAVQTLYSTDFSKHVHLKEACLEAVKSCCSVMAWPQFKRFLLQSVWDIDKHKQGLGVVCSTLEVFPFDLTKSTSKLSNGNKLDNFVVKFPEIKDKKEVESDEEPMEIGPEEVGDSAPASQTDGILDDVIKHVIPRLRNILNRKESDEDQHKLSTAKADIDKCKRKIPLALAIVSVLRKLPESTLKAQLPGVVLKVVGFLRHKLHEVRLLATSTMVKVVGSLKLSYLTLVLREMKSGLSKGYQKHVLVSAVYAVVISLGSRVEVGGLDFCIPQLLEILNEDLFGATAAEKKVEKLQSKIPEARGRSKAYAAYKILATVVGRASIMSLIEPIKTRLEDTRNHSVKKIARDVFVDISLGLLENKSLTAHDFLALVYGILCEKIPGLFAEESVKPKKKIESTLQPLSLILAQEPARYGTKAPAKTVKTNMHLLVEFSQQLLHLTIKRQIVSLTDQSHLEMLDQFVDKLKNSLKSSHQQTVVDAIRCLTRLFRTNLPSMNQYRGEITNSLFKILRDQTKGASNQEMSAVTFKSLCVLCSTDHAVAINETQLKILLTYAEEDLYNTQRQSHAFDLVKSILKRGLQGPEVVEVIDKVRKIAIQSHTSSARAQARSLYLHFVVNYPLSPKQLDGHIEFVLAQLTYEFEEGRMSTLEMLSTIVTTFPMRIVSSHAGIIFVPSAAMLINDDSAKCRKMAAGVVKFLLERLDVDNRNQLFSFVLHWYDSEDTKQRRLAAMLVSIFSEVLQTAFQRHVPGVFSLIHKSIETESSTESEDDNVKTRDHNLFFHLSAFLAILRHCEVITSKDVRQNLESILGQVTELLGYPHDWVRLVCCQILGCVFAQFSPDEFAEVCRNSVPYFRQDMETKLGDLCHRLHLQLKADDFSGQLAEQVVKNLLFLLRVLDCFEKTRSEEKVHPTILKLIKQLIVISKFEQSDKPKETSKRTAVLKLCAALCVNLPQPERVLKLILEPIYRGINASATHGSNEIEAVTALRTLATQVLDVVKKKVESEVFSKTYMTVTRKITHKQRERKREKAVQLVADPRKAAAFKLRKHERTKMQRKRKIANMRPEYGLAAKMKRS